MSNSKDNNRKNKIIENDSNYKMYIFVNTSLDMSKGKIAAQVGHAVQHIVEDIFVRYYEGSKEYKTIFNDYLIWSKNYGCAKIALKANQDQINILSQLPIKLTTIHDAGKTQVEPNSLTVVAFYPMDINKLPIDMSQYKLL
jgi:peptidyl-tRNA hydrolase, PTH2 family